MSTAPGSTFDLTSSPLFVRRAVIFAVSSCLTFVAAQAQQTIDTRTSPMQTVASITDGPLNFDLARAAGANYSTSASSALDAVDADAAANLDLPAAPGDAAQPPPRRRYGRPRYNDNNHNADGSSKYEFIGGVGLTLPSGNTYHYLNTSYSYQVGAGRNFNKNFSLLFQFDWDNFGFNGRTLGNQLAIENQSFAAYCAANPTNPVCANGSLQSLDGSSHVWSFSLNPIYNIYTHEGLGAYVVAGVGFYHKVATFTTPQQGYYFDPYYQTYIAVVANQTVDHYSANAPGFSGGFGLTFKPSRFSSQRLYIEGRYVFVDNAQRRGVTIGNIGTVTATTTNLYPANSNRTTYIPIKAGIRF